MKLNPNRERIKIHTHITAEQDRVEVVELLGDFDFDELLNRVFENLRDMADALRHGCAHLGVDLSKRRELTIADLIETFEQAIRAHATSGCYLERFLDDMSNCRLANDETERVLRIYAADPDLELMAPLAHLGDLLVSAVSDFDESMRIENGYARPGTRYECVSAKPASSGVSGQV